jgi:ribose transport system substrate-binding protein
MHRFVILSCALQLGCGATPAPPREYHFAWIPKVLNNPVFEAGRDGAFLRAAELTQEKGTTVKVAYTAPTEATGMAQTDIFKQAVMAKPDAIAISVVDAASTGPAIDAAITAGIPVMTFDSDASATHRFTLLSLNNVVAGANAAKLLAKVLNESGKVSIIASTSPNLQDRVTGFKNELMANHPNVTVLDVLNVPGEDATAAGQLIETEMTNHPELTGWFFAGPWSLFQTGNIDTVNPKWSTAAKSGAVKTVSFDTLPQELTLVQGGYIQALIGQKYWGWGYQSIDVLYQHVKDSKSFDAITDTGMDIVCSDNATAMQAMWAANQFNTTLPACNLLP